MPGKTGINRGILVSVITVPRIKGKAVLKFRNKPKITVPTNRHRIVAPKNSNKQSLPNWVKEVTKGMPHKSRATWPVPHLSTPLFLIPNNERVDAEAVNKDLCFPPKKVSPLPMQNSKGNLTTFLSKVLSWTKRIQEKKKTRDGCSSSFLNLPSKPTNSTRQSRYLIFPCLSYSSSSFHQINSTETTHSQRPHSSHQWKNH